MRRISLPSIGRPNVLSRITQSKFWKYRYLLLAGLAAGLGGTLLIAGLFLVIMMFLSSEVLGVIAAAAMISVGAVLVLAVYIWITLPG